MLDEPTNHLDPKHQLDALSLFRRLADPSSIVIAALHDPNLAAIIADRLVLMRDGRVLVAGTPREVLTQSG